MFDGKAWKDDENIPTESKRGDQKTIDDVDTTTLQWKPTIKFVAAFAIGAFFFLFPVEWQGQITIPLDVLATVIQETSILAVELFTLGLIVGGAVLTTISMLESYGYLPVSERTASLLQLDYWQTSKLFWTLRVLAIAFAVPIFVGVGPEWLIGEATAGIVWGALLLTIALVIPFGAVFVNLLAELGGLQFIGTLAQPIMRPFYYLPGRSALDSAASWLGSFSIGYYLTRNVFDRGGYNKREVFVICTCFATANLGTVGAVAAVLGILHLFPLIVLLYILATLIVAAILVRIPPLSNVPNEYVAEPDPEPRFTGTVGDYFRFAFSEGVRTAKQGDSILRASVIGFIDGAKLTAMIIGTVLTIGMAAVALEEYTAFFEYASMPLIPVLTALGVPDPQMAATAIIVGGAEYFVGATMVVGAETFTQVFVVIVVSAQAIFFAASAPMMVDMFDDVPIRFRDLFVLLVLRTAFLIPVAAVLTHVVAVLGLI